MSGICVEGIADVLSNLVQAVSHGCAGFAKNIPEYLCLAGGDNSVLRKLADDGLSATAKLCADAGTHVAQGGLVGIVQYGNLARRKLVCASGINLGKVFCPGCLSHLRCHLPA